MKQSDPGVFHNLYVKSKPRVVYYKKDFFDYLLMLSCSALVISFSYGFGRALSLIGAALCTFMLMTFAIRHGIALSVPVILRKPQEVLYTFAYKLRNLKPVYFFALGLLLLENLLISLTPSLPHHVELMRRIALYLFYIHFIGITAFRTIILVDHLAKKELIREVLMQTPWKRIVKENTNITVEALHAYSTGILTHIITIAPWFLVIRFLKFSVIFLPVVALLNIVIHRKWYKALNAWFYRDHWLGHNSEFEFVFLHGTHHDAIPSGMIAVAENGLLEGFLRYVAGAPNAAYNPLISFAVFTAEVTGDIATHQYIPGIFPKLPKADIEVLHHSTHHYGPLEPYSIAIAPREEQANGSSGSKKAFSWIPNEVIGSVKLDQELTGYELDNPTYRRILSLYRRYQS